MSNIFRVQSKASNFTVIANEPLNDESISWKAKGLLVYLLSKPNNWKVQPEQLKKASLGGRDAIYSILKELIIAGYIRRNSVRNSEGKVVSVEYVVYETKNQLPEKPDMALPFPENPDTGNPDINKDLELVSTDLTKNGMGQRPPTQTVEEKKKKEKIAFCKSIISFIKSNQSKYPKLMYVEFSKYWMETNGNGKMRFQGEKFFEVGRRLSTWFKNSKPEELTRLWEAEKSTEAVNILLSKLL